MFCRSEALGESLGDSCFCFALMFPFRSILPSILREIPQNTQNQPPQVFYKKAVLKNFTIFTWKHLCQSFLESFLCWSHQCQSLFRVYFCHVTFFSFSLLAVIFPFLQPSVSKAFHLFTLFSVSLPSLCVRYSYPSANLAFFMINLQYSQFSMCLVLYSFNLLYSQTSAL